MKLSRSFYYPSRVVLAGLLVAVLGCRESRPGASPDWLGQVELPKKMFLPERSGDLTIRGHFRQMKRVPKVTGPEFPQVNTVRITCSKVRHICELWWVGLFGPSNSVTAFKQNIDRNLLEDAPRILIGPVNGPIEFSVISWLDGNISARFEPRSADVDLLISVEQQLVSLNYRETKARGNETANPDIWETYVLE